MADRYVLSVRKNGSSLFDRKPARDQEIVLRAQRLEPDEAIFVTAEGPLSVAPERYDEIVRLRTRLRHRLSGLSLLVLEDHENGGAWVYRRRASVGTGSAVGPVKEAEIRSRPISPPAATS